MDFEIQQNYNEDEIIDKVKEDVSSVIQNKEDKTEEKINNIQKENNNIQRIKEEDKSENESNNENKEPDVENEKLNSEKETENRDENTGNDKSYSFEDGKNIENNEKKDQINEEKNNENKEDKTEENAKNSLILPKEFKYLLDTVKEFNDVLSITANPDFVKNALKKELKEELIKTSKNIAKQFAKETIEKFDKNHFQMIKEKRKIEFVKNLDLNSPVIKDKINLVYLDRKEQHKQSVFDYNNIYRYYGKLVKNKPKYKDYFDKIIKVNFFVEDYFIL